MSATPHSDPEHSVSSVGDLIWSLPNTWLAVPPTPLIGREQELATILDLLLSDDVRLLTITGSPGVGKTRLCLQVAHSVRDQFPAGICFVSLAQLRDSDRVIPAIARAMGLQGEGEGLQAGALESSLIRRFQIALQHRRLLLVLDNFEQVIPAAKQIAELLFVLDSLKVLVTSRLALHISAEREYAVPPLKLPPPDQQIAPQTLAGYPAIALFTARAQAIKPDFQLNPANAAVVAQICQRLEGIPLAIELAAARSKLLAPQALLAWLTHAESSRLITLTSGARDLPTRQQTLRNAIAWSYALLQPDEQQFFCCLGVFVGGWTIEAAQAVARFPSSMSVIDALSNLLDHSLLQRLETETSISRFSMLEMIREYALEQSEANGDAESLRRSHAGYYCQLAEAGEQELHGPHQMLWLDQLEAEYDNLLAALTWSHRARDAELVLRLVAALGEYWWLRWLRGHVGETSQWLRTILDLRLTILDSLDSVKQASPKLDFGNLKSKIAKTLCRAGLFAWYQGDFAQTAALCAESLRLCQSLDDKQGMAEALRYLSFVALDKGEFVQAAALLEESLALSAAIDNKEGMAWALCNLGDAVRKAGDVARGEVLYLDGLQLFREIGDKEDIANKFAQLGALSARRGNDPRAMRLLEESLTLTREVGHAAGTAFALRVLSLVASRQGDDPKAATALLDCLKLDRRLGNRQGLAECLLKLCVISSKLGQVANAACFSAASEIFGVQPSISLSPVEREHHNRQIQVLRTQMGDAAYDAAWAHGSTLNIEHALIELEKIVAPSQTPAAPAAQLVYPTDQHFEPLPDGQEALTARELDVLRLVVRGLTYEQIGKQLFIGTRTVESHLRTVYGKLGVRSRHEATRHALQHRLV